MDPDTTLQQLRSILRDRSVPARDRALQAEELFAALDTWLQGGGFLPAPWEVYGDEVSEEAGR
jgi:hypothetical protein